MSQTIRNGQSIRVNIQTGEKLTAVAVTGSYSITVLAGTGTGTSLATSATGGTYGPYAYPLVVQIVASAASEIDYDAGATTSIESDTVALLKTDPLTGGVSLMAGGAKLGTASQPRGAVIKFSNILGLTNTRQATGTGDSLVADTTIYRTGGASIKLTTPTNGTLWAEIGLPTLAQAFGRLRTQLMVYIPDFTKVGNITLYLSKDVGYSNFVTLAYKVMDTGGNSNRYNGWHCITTPNGTVGVAVGAGSVVAGDTITTAKIRVQPPAGVNSTVVYFDALYLDQTAKPAILITADDNYDSWMQYGLSYLNAKSLKSTLAVIGSTIGTTNYMTLAELMAAYTAGHDCVTHGVASLASLANAKARVEDVLANKSFLINNGLTRRNGQNHYVFPNGIFELSSGDQEIMQVMQQTGMLSARGVVKPTRLDASIDFGDRWKFYNILGGENTDSPATLISLINDCVTYGESGVLMFHKIVTGATGANIEYNKEDFESVINHIAALRDAGAIDVLTIPEFYERARTSPIVAV